MIRVNGEITVTVVIDYLKYKYKNWKSHWDPFRPERSNRVLQGLILYLKWKAMSFWGLYRTAIIHRFPDGFDEFMWMCYLMRLFMYLDQKFPVESENHKKPQATTTKKWKIRLFFKILSKFAKFDQKLPFFDKVLAIFVQPWFPDSTGNFGPDT